MTTRHRPSDITAIIEPKRTSALIGAIVLEDLDLLVDCHHQRVVPSHSRGAIYEIDSTTPISSP
jgi:hypothetical protein